jgi:hypothetical protein
MVEKPADLHIGLSTASGIAYDQLAERKRGFYDVEHFNEVLNNAAQALISITPIYLIDPVTGERRRVSDAELLEARVSRGATVLILADGRSVKDLSLLRSDLTAALKILKTTGLKAFLSTKS